MKWYIEITQTYDVNSEKVWIIANHLFKRGQGADIEYGLLNDRVLDSGAEHFNSILVF